MPSRSLLRWAGERAAALDEIETAHALVGGTERGRRYATQQINYAYAALLSAQFQGFCRDLHSECVDAVVSILPAHVRRFIGPELTRARASTAGTHTPGPSGPTSTASGSTSGAMSTGSTPATAGGASCSRSWWTGGTRSPTKTSKPWPRTALPRYSLPGSVAGGVRSAPWRGRSTW